MTPKQENNLLNEFEVEIIKWLQSNNENSTYIASLLVEKTKEQLKDVTTFQEAIDEIGLWSDKTFGEEPRYISMIHHLQKETKELIDILNTLKIDALDESIGVGEWRTTRERAKLEFADCFMLLFDSARKFGLNAEEIVHLMRLKLAINKMRNWGVPDENGIVEHIKE